MSKRNIGREILDGIREIKAFKAGKVDLKTCKVTEPSLPDESATSATLGDLLNSEFFGMWGGREDIEDSAEFGRQLRQDAWTRSS